MSLVPALPGLSSSSSSSPSSWGMPRTMQWFNNMNNFMKSSGLGNGGWDAREVSPKELAEFEQDWMDLDSQSIYLLLEITRKHPLICMPLNFIKAYILSRGVRLKETTPIFKGDSQTRAFAQWFSQMSKPICERALDYSVALGWCHSTVGPDEKFGCRLLLIDPLEVGWQMRSNAAGEKIIRPKMKDSKLFGAFSSSSSSSSSRYVRDGFSGGRLGGSFSLDGFQYPDHPKIYMWRTYDPNSDGTLASPIVAVLEDLAFGQLLRNHALAVMEQQRNMIVFVTQKMETQNDQLALGTDMAEALLPRCENGFSSSSSSSSQQFQFAANQLAYRAVQARNNGGNRMPPSFPRNAMTTMAESLPVRRINLLPGQEVKNADRPPDPPDFKEYEEKLAERISDHLQVPQMCFRRTKNVVLSKQTNGEDTADRLLMSTLQRWAFGLWAPILRTFYLDSYREEHEFQKTKDKGWKELQTQKRKKARKERNTNRKQRRKEKRKNKRIRASAKEDGEASSSDEEADRSSSSSDDISSDSEDTEKEEDESGYSDKNETWGCEIQFDALIKKEDIIRLRMEGLFTDQKYREYTSVLTNIPLGDLLEQPEQPKAAQEGFMQAAEMDARIKLDLAKAKTEKEKPEMEREKMKHEDKKAETAEKKTQLDMVKMDKGLEVQTKKFALDKQKNAYKDKRDAKRKRQQESKERRKKKKSKK